MVKFNQICPGLWEKLVSTDLPPGPPEFPLEPEPEAEPMPELGWMAV